MDQTERKSRLPRKLLAGLVLLELVSLPAAAQIVDRVSFRAAPVVISSELPHQTDGMRSYLVATNTPFSVEVTGTVGDVSVRVATTGHYGDLLYGTNAQLPGPRATCVRGRPGTVTAYRASRKTAARRGDVRSHAVRVDVSFDPVASPGIALLAAEEGSAADGRACAAESDSRRNLAP